MIDYNLLTIQNPWWQNSGFIKDDSKIKEFDASLIKYLPKEILNLNLKNQAINIVSGPRQTGKSTAIKLFIKKLLKQDFPAERIFYFNCDALDSKQELIELIMFYFEIINKKGKTPLNYLFLDEISAVKDWPFGIKWLFDTGLLKNSKIILTGSSSINLKKSGEFLPGRRGGGLDIKFLPINFFKFFKLLHPQFCLPKKFKIINDLEKLQFELAKEKINIKKLYHDFLLTGGFLKIINLNLKKELSGTTVELYINTLKSELAKFGKKEINCRHILKKIVDSLTSESSYSNIAEEAELGSKNTVIDYINFFKDSFFLQEVLFYSLPQKRIVIKKNKKYYPTDPFLVWIFQAFILASNQIEGLYQKYLDSPLDSQLAEVFVSSELYKQDFDIYFYKNSKELDFYLPKKNLGLEVKYKNKLISTDFKGLSLAKKKILVSKNTLEQRKDVLIVPAYLFGFMVEFL